MIVYRHRSEMTHPDLDGWQPRPESTVCICHQMSDGWNHVAIVEPFLWQIPKDDTAWQKLSGDWECAYVPGRGGVVYGRDLARLDAWASPLPVLDAKGAHWLAPVILTGDGARAFPVRYSGADFLPSLTPEQSKTETIVKEARDILWMAKRQADSGDSGAGIPQTAACRWTAVLLAVSHHLSAETIAAAGILDDVLIRKTLIAASGLDRRMDG